MKRQALELLLQVDEAAAEDLMLTRGTTAPRNGTRVAVCELLASLPGPAVDAALLERLSLDRSKWVRLHALRSLLTPGHSVSADVVMAAMAAEEDSEVLAQRRALLGR